MINMRRKIGYGLGDMGNSISYFTVSFFFLFYLTDILLLPPALAGFAYFIGLAWDSINDVFIAVINDRTRSRYGRKRVYLLWGAVPFAISFIILWLTPLYASQTVKFTYAILSLLVYTTIYSLVTVPYLSLVPDLSRDYDERTQITGIRAILSTVGIILGGGTALLVSRFPNELMGLRVMAVTFGILATITTLIAAQSVRGVEPNEEEITHRPQVSMRLYWILLKDRNVFILMFYKFLSAIGTGALMASLPYFAKHALGDEGYSTFGLLIYILCTAGFVPVVNLLTRRYDKRKLLLIGMVTAATVLLAIGLLAGPSSTTLFYGGCALLGLAMSTYVLIPYSLVPDLVDYYDYKTGDRHESVFFGLWLTFHQMGIAAAGFLLGSFLQIQGYKGELAVQSPSALLAVRLSLSILPGFFLVIASFVLQSYGITRSYYQKIQAGLAKSALNPE
jgi:glycoside/pentoside/hexuronide:cation symporter, GPH family